MTSRRIPEREPSSLRSQASRAASDRAKEEIRAQLRKVALRHLAEGGSATLSLRAVARELNMTSSAVYRYVESREALINSLIVEACESVAEVAELADGECAATGADAASRWLEIARAMRAWAQAHPHEYVTSYGAPSRSGRASDGVLRATARIWRVIAGVLNTAMSTGVLQPPAKPFDVDGLHTDQVVRTIGQPSPPFTDSTVRAMSLFSSLLGAISAEMFGHFDGLTNDLDRTFDLVVATGAQGVGLDLPVHLTELIRPQPV